MGSRSIMSSPSLDRKKNHYSNDAVEKANENRIKHGNWNPARPGPCLGIGCMVAFPVRMPTLDRAENHCSNREAGELGEQKVNFKSQPNKEKGYLCVPPPVVG